MLGYMKPLKVAFLNRGRDAFPGGDAVALDATMDALRARGHECVETGWDKHKLSMGRFDMAHIFHTNFSWSYGNYEAVRDVGLPYVLTPVYYPGPLLSGITEMGLREILGTAKRVIPFSRRESKQIADDLSSPAALSFPAIPNATAPEFHAPDGREYMPMLDVLTVSARGHSDKNIALVKKNCDGLGVSLTVAAGLSRKELANTYKHHRVFVNASGSERMSLTIGEALCAGCRALATDQNWGNEYYPGLITFSPDDPVKLEHLIRWALSSQEWDFRPNQAARCLTWDWVAGKLEGVYRECLTS